MRFNEVFIRRYLNKNENDVDDHDHDDHDDNNLRIIDLLTHTMVGLAQSAPLTPGEPHNLLSRRTRPGPGSAVAFFKQLLAFLKIKTRRIAWSCFKEWKLLGYTMFLAFLELHHRQAKGKRFLWFY